MHLSYLIQVVCVKNIIGALCKILNVFYNRYKALVNNFDNRL